MYISKYNNSKAEQELYKDMRELIMQLKKASSKSNFDRLASDLNLLYNLANNHDLYDYPIVDDFVSRKTEIGDSIIRTNIFLKNYKRLLELINKDIDYHQDFASNFTLFDELDYEKDYHELAYVEDNELIYHAEQFMKTFDEDMFNNYQRLVKNNHVLLSDYDETGLGGLFTPIHQNMMPYLSFYINNNIDDSSTIVHEAAHLRQFDFMKNNYVNSNYSYIFREVYSYYMQFVFYDYLKNKNLYQKDIDTCFNHCLGNLNECLINLYDSLDNLSYDNIDLYTDLQYTYGMTIALKYFDIYKNDPEYAKYLTDDFIKNSYKLEPLEVLNNFGLDKDEIKEGLIIQKYLKK